MASPFGMVTDVSLAETVLSSRISIMCVMCSVPTESTIHSSLRLNLHAMLADRGASLRVLYSPLQDVSETPHVALLSGSREGCYQPLHMMPSVFPSLVKYCLELLHEFELLACRPVMTHLPENIVLAHKETGGDTQNMHAPLQLHFDIGLRVLKYLKLASGNGIGFSKSNDGFKGNVLATCKVIWVLKILKDLGLDGLVLVTLFCDNKPAIQIGANPVMYEKTKHFDIDVHLAKKKVASVTLSEYDIHNCSDVQRTTTGIHTATLSSTSSDIHKDSGNTLSKVPLKKCSCTAA
nr:hypothetical protein [Tanacetum cinerariifolium]